MPKVWLNGRLVEEAEASIPLRDTGLLHAAGVFTTMRAYGGRVFRLTDHLARLRQSCQALLIPLTYSDEALIQAARELLADSDLSDARLRLTVTRGLARPDPLHGTRLDPNVFLTAARLEPYPAEYYQRGMSVIVLDEQKLNPYDVQAGHKTLNYLSRLEALRSASLRGCGEALWFNVHNYLQSGSICNVFVVKNGRLITPPTPQDLHDLTLARAIPYPKSATLPGITRKVVLELAAADGIEVSLAAIDINQLLEADEVFLTNSVMQVMPVCRIERRNVGAEAPGPLTRRLASLYEQAVRDG